MFELDGKTAVVIGVGGIGSNIAQRAHGFGMKVVGVDVRDIPPGMFLQRVVPPDMLDSVLPEADVVFVSVPHTKKSDGMMGARQFELMKQGSYFIAMSRGRVYDHNALVKALDTKRLAGAGLDVTDPEPLPKGDPLWKFPNVVITPHTSGGSDNLQGRLDKLVKENIRRFGLGLPLLNVVDKKEGF
jgi:phosphoglycerate dehydrogenase-like enzyme